MKTTAEGMMSWAVRVVVAALVISALAFVLGVGWVLWGIAQYVGLL